MSEITGLQVLDILTRSPRELELEFHEREYRRRYRDFVHVEYDARELCAGDLEQ